jgi:hypothetical protein
MRHTKANTKSETAACNMYDKTPLSHNGTMFIRSIPPTETNIYIAKGSATNESITARITDPTDNFRRKITKAETRITRLGSKPDTIPVKGVWVITIAKTHTVIRMTRVQSLFIIKFSLRGVFL